MHYRKYQAVCCSASERAELLNYQNIPAHISRRFCGKCACGTAAANNYLCFGKYR
jgi:hypothetical protein